MLEKAKQIVMDYYNKQNSENSIPLTDVFVVWFCKTLQNWKALVGTATKDSLYYEVTYNGDKDETYLDVYDKIKNIKISKNEETVK